MKTIVFVFAHPDDEAFVAGGTIAKYHQMGYKVHLICVTKGEAGTWGDVTSEELTLSEVRSNELVASCRELGVDDFTLLSFADGGLKELPPGELEEVLYKKYVDIQPDIVVTFESHGISNHPDHVKLSLSATYAFQKYAVYFIKGIELGKRDPRRKFVNKLGGFEDREEPKLYHACIPQEVVNFLLEHEVIPGEAYGKPWQGVADKKVTHVIDIRDVTEIKLKALAQHKTQFADVEKFVSIDNQPLMFQEYYILRMQGEEEIFMGKDDHVQTEL